MAFARQPHRPATHTIVHGHAAFPLAFAAALTLARGSGHSSRLFWASVLLGAGSGLMCISQATAMVTAYGGSLALAVFGTTMVAAGNCAGRLIGGALSDYLPVRSVAIGAHTIGAVRLFGLAVFPSATVAVIAIAMAGLSYGMQTGAYPSAMAIYYGSENFGRMMGRLITAWDIAGLAAPIIAGALFDLTGSYRLAVAFAAIVATLAIVVSARLPGRSVESRPA